MWLNRTIDDAHNNYEMSAAVTKTNKRIYYVVKWALYQPIVNSP